MRALSLLLTFFVLLGCNKSKLEKVPVNEDLKAAFNYKPGTYWIYKDSISGQIDSFRVISNYDAYNDITTSVKQSIENILITITQYKSTPSTIDTQIWKFSYESNCFNITYNEPKLYTGEIEYIPLLNYPFQNSIIINEHISQAFQDTSSISFLNAYSIGGQTFANNAVINHWVYLKASYNYPLLNSYSYNDCFYLCPFVGLIKIKLDHPNDSLYKVWEIQRWHIVK
jgi:hypothetical protein